jgi:hypothetical protein
VSQLIFKRASASRPSGEWSDNDFDVLASSVVIGRIMKGSRVTRRHAVDVDARVWPPWPHANAWLRADARGCDGGIRKELATRVRHF